MCSNGLKQSLLLIKQEAESELNDIEWDYFRHVIGDDYLNACWTFNDLEKAGVAIDKPSLETFECREFLSYGKLCACQKQG